MTSVISARYARRCRRRVHATNPGDSQLDEHFSQYPLSLLWNARQLPQGYGFAAAVASSSKELDTGPVSSSVERSDGAAVGASAALSMMQLLQHYDARVLRGNRRVSEAGAPQLEGCPGRLACAVPCTLWKGGGCSSLRLAAR